MNKKVLRNGFVVDGSGSEGFYSDILIEGEFIKRVEKNVVVDEETKEIDVKGLVISPGFIDTHSHSDAKLLVEPLIDQKVAQGITTEILGQDGISMAPLPKKFIEPWRKNIAGLDGDFPGIDWNFKDTKGYLKMIEKMKPAFNVAYLLPHGNVRMEAMGLDNREPNKKELEKMKKIIEREMKNGAIGFSSGLIYIPCAYSKTDEIIECCKVVAKYNGIFVVHQRSEADDILSSADEIIEIGRKSKVKIHFSHMKVCGLKNAHKIPLLLEKFDKAKKEEGIEISFDQYPYVAGSTMLGVILPPWVHEGGTDMLLKRLKDKETRKKIVTDIKKGIPGWDNFVDFAGMDKIIITSVKNKKNEKYIGKTLEELGNIKKQNPFDSTFDLLIEEENDVGMVNFYGKEEDIATFIKREEHNVCTDALLGKGKPHPRSYGSFPKILSKYVREEKLITLENAIYKMSGKPAKLFKIDKRGFIKEGYFADLTIFDIDLIKDNASYIESTKYPTGIKYVFVNGEKILEDEKPFYKPAGKVIRHNI